MASSKDRSDSGRVRGGSVDQGSRGQPAPDSPRQIALDALEADRQAVELNPPSWNLSTDLWNGPVVAQ